MSNASISSFRHSMNYERREYKANDLVWFCIVYCLYIKQAFWLQYISLSLIYFSLKIKICIAVCITMSTPTSILVLYVDNINGIPILVLDVDSYINGISQLLLLLVLPTAENSPNEVRARERESANPRDIFLRFTFFQFFLSSCFLYLIFSRLLQ